MICRFLKNNSTLLIISVALMWTMVRLAPNIIKIYPDQLLSVKSEHNVNIKLN